MSRWGKVQNIPAGGGNVPFMPRTEARYVVQHVKSEEKTSQQGKGDFWYCNFKIVSVDFLGGEEDPPPSRPGQVRCQQFMYSNGLEYGVSLAKAVALSFLGLEESDFDELEQNEAIEFMETFFPPPGKDPFEVDEPMYAVVTTSKGFNRDKSTKLTDHSWEPLGDVEEAELREAGVI